MSDFDQLRNSAPKGLGEPPRLGEAPAVPAPATPAVQEVSQKTTRDAPIADFSAANAYNATVEKPVLTKKAQREAVRTTKPVLSSEEVEAAKQKRKKVLMAGAGVLAGAVVVAGGSFWLATKPAGPDPVAVEYAALADEYDSLKAERAILLCSEVSESVQTVDAFTRLGSDRGALLAYTSSSQLVGGQEVPLELRRVLADAYNLVDLDSLSDSAVELAQSYVGEPDPEAACLQAEGAPLVRSVSPLERDVEGVGQEVSALEDEIARLSGEEAGSAVIPVDLWVSAQDDKDDLLALLALATPAEALSAEFAETDPALLDALLGSREGLVQAEQQLKEGEYDLSEWVDALEAIIKYSVAAEDLILSTNSSESNTDEATTDGEN